MGEHDMDELAARVAAKLFDMLKGIPHLCLRTDEIAKLQANDAIIMSSHGKICDKLDVMHTMLYKFKTDKNIIIASIGACGVIVGTSIPFVLPWLIAFISKIF